MFLAGNSFLFIKLIVIIFYIHFNPLFKVPQKSQNYWDNFKKFPRQYDLRENNAPLEFDFSDQYGPLKTLALNQIRPEQLALGISNPMVPIYDRRNMKNEPMLRLLPGIIPLNLIC